MHTLLPTQDGSHTLISDRYGIPYHSRYGAVQESRHVFIKMGLYDLLLRQPPEVRILELGFGTGLNAFLTLLEADRRPELPVFFTSLEDHPVSEETARQLNYCKQLAVTDRQTDFLDLHRAPWDEQTATSPNFTLHKIAGSYLELDLPADRFDLVYYDAFAPVTQPELWTPPALARAYRALAPGGALVTYCAKGQVKRNLKSIGFKVEGVEGPPGKREMIRAVRE
ncbi:MAG: tRNA (5-methylaminomethyl-2-thiouridine)(34)-methyltransferase MnmD [Saprospiraceae bacterium]